MLIEDSFCSQILLNSGHYAFDKFHRGKKVLFVGCTWLRLILVMEWSLPNNSFVTSVKQCLAMEFEAMLRSSMFHRPAPTR